MNRRVRRPFQNHYLPDRATRLPRFQWANLWMILFLLGCRLEAVPTSTTPTQPTSTSTPITVWSFGNFWNTWRAEGPAIAAQRLPNITVIPVAKPITDENFLQDINEAAATFTLPDIVFTDSSNDIFAWIEAGYLAPLNDCIQQHAEFDDILPDLWLPVTQGGQVWAVPLEIGVRFLTFSKVKLREMGWSESQIDELPLRIQAGDFTLDDMANAAREAIAKGVVESGNGYWPRPEKNSSLQQFYVAYGGDFYDAAEEKFILDEKALTQTYAFHQRLLAENISSDIFVGVENNSWLARLIWRDALWHHRVLFWSGANWDIAHWVANYNLAYQEIFDQFGFALWPSGIRGEAGFVLSSPKYYVITRDSAAQGRYTAACAVLAKTMTPSIESEIAIRDGNLGSLTSLNDYPPYRDHPLIVETLSALDYTRYEQYRGYFPSAFPLKEYLNEVEKGRLTPEQAARQAIEAILRSYSGDVIVK